MNYQGILQSVGWPTDILTLDFETYFDQEYSLKKMSTIEYICDKRFEITGLGTYTNIAPASEFYTPDELNKAIPLTDFNKFTVVVQNARFDITILQTKFGIVPKYIIDILDLARHYDSRMRHDLGTLSTLFKLKPKGDVKQFSGLHYQDMTPEQRKALEKYCLTDIENETELFKILLPYISNPEMEIPLARHTLKMYLRPQICFDFQKAGTLRGSMISELDKIITSTGYSKKQLGGNISFVKILDTVLPKGETTPMKKGKKKLIPALAKDDEKFQELLVHPDEKVRNLCKARQAVKSWPLHLKRIDNMANQADCSGRFLRTPLNYYGGHTGRWSGGEGINLQNLGGRGRAGSGIHPLIGEMRSLLTTPDEYLFLIVDSAQIEARILAWLAGQDDLIQGFINGDDVYSTFATGLFDSSVYKPADDEPDCIKQILKIRRGFGKDAVLGCGYGMGAEKFYNRCRANEDLRPLFDSGEYNFAFIERLIKTYRKTYNMIPKFWNSVEKAFRWVVKYPHQEVLIDTDFIGPRLTFWNKNGTVHLQLPSGRCLRYRHACIDKKNNLKWHWGKLYGALLVENIVQACARDLLGCWILEWEKHGLPIVLHTHDELVSLVPEIEAKISLQLLLGIMSTGPNWAQGLPLDAEGKISKVYVK